MVMRMGMLGDDTEPELMDTEYIFPRLLSLLIHPTHLARSLEAKGKKSNTHLPVNTGNHML
jgi:hypothetical protein